MKVLQKKSSKLIYALDEYENFRMLQKLNTLR